MNSRPPLLLLFGGVILMIAILATNAGAAERKRCSDTKGSVLAMHSRTLCADIDRRHPRAHVRVSCSTVTRTESSCTWSWATRDRGCHGKATVKGVAHPRITYRDRACVA